jgi:aminomethyltransferase
MICAEDGGIIDDLIVYRLAETRFVVVANASNARAVSNALAHRFDGFKAVIDDRSLATGLVAIQGPRSLEILGPLADIDLDAIRYYGIAEGAVAGIAVMIARTGYTGEDGFEVFVDVARVGDVWDAVLEAGRPRGLMPVGLGARDTLRLEAGMPLYGNELDRSTNPYEAGLGRVVKLAKTGPFTGREALAKVARDGTARRLVGLALRERGIARHGYPVLAGGVRTGAVTSGTMSPTLNTAIAMAYVASGHAEPGTMLAVEIRGAPVAAEVVPLPFYKRPA